MKPYVSNLIYNSLAISYWNIDGLYERINNQRICKFENELFSEKVKNFDIIGLVETHCETKDQPILEGYNIYNNCRKKSLGARKASGGLAICIHQAIAKGITIIPPTNSEISWICLKKHFFGMTADIFMAFVYISPEGSSYSSKRDDIFTILQNDIAKYDTQGECIICGDFNAKTCKDADYVEDDIDLNSLINLDNYIQDEPIDRRNLDNRVTDVHGKKLLELCKSTGLRILNGRIMGDLTGKFTCYNYVGSPSVIDYILTKQSYFNNITRFVVNDLCPLSIHCMLSMYIKIPLLCLQNHEDQLIQNPRKLKWKSNSGQAFEQALSTPKIIKQIYEYCNTSFDPNAAGIYTATDKLNDIFHNASEHCKIFVSIPNKSHSKMWSTKYVLRKKKKKMV